MDEVRCQIFQNNDVVFDGKMSREQFLTQLEQNAKARWVHTRESLSTDEFFHTKSRGTDIIWEDFDGKILAIVYL